MSFFIQQNFIENFDGYERIVITATLINAVGKQTITGGVPFLKKNYRHSCHLNIYYVDKNIPAGAAWLWKPMPLSSQGTVSVLMLRPEEGWNSAVIESAEHL